MMARLLRALIGLLLVCAALPAGAADKGIRQFKAGEPITLRAEKAYVLLGLDTDLSKFDAVILRVPDRLEIAEYETAKQKAYDAAMVVAKGKLARNPKDKAVERLGSYADFRFNYDKSQNLLSIRPNTALTNLNKVSTVLAEITPGDYVVYGEGYASFIYQCFCLGTVGFTAKAGKVTDLGTMLFAKAWEPSPIPELAGEVDLGKSAVMDYGLFAVALRPAKSGSTMPPGLDPASVHPAALRAIGPFVETNVVLINRLAAIPGVLAYDQGRVIDVPSGKALLPD